MDRSDWACIFIIIAIGGLVYTCVKPLKDHNSDKWDTIIERCHDVPGRDYDGCLHRGNLEWNRGGKNR